MAGTAALLNDAQKTDELDHRLCRPLPDDRTARMPRGIDEVVLITLSPPTNGTTSRKEALRSSRCWSEASLHHEPRVPRQPGRLSMNWLERQRVRHTLSHYPIPHESWNRLVHEADLFRGLSAVELAHLRELSTLFLHRKAFSAMQELEVTTDILISVAAQACLLVLKLGLDYYDGWGEVILYPGAFRVSRQTRDAAGVVSDEDNVLAGESWQQGPVVLSWDTAASDLAGHRSGHNVVVHEFAHKLDSLDGSADGIPPLHSTMIRQHWTQAFTGAFDALCSQLEHHHPHRIDAYAATSPAEFFAVSSEYFFAAPATLQHEFPAVYEQLVLFYRQDPKSRLAAAVHP
jgi:Mlc titration factor MtfA (ptsG expression regulator)